MPNWCNNELTLSHPDKAMIDRVLKAWHAGYVLSEFIPVPKALVETVSGWFGDAEKQKENQDKQAKNLQDYGYKTWYEFCVNEWGTKWDIGKSEDYDEEPIRVNDNTIHFYFDSAWSPPIHAYSKLEAMGFEVEAYYYEGGIGFWGKYVKGVDYEYDTKEIPENIREMFGIEEITE